MFLTTDVVFLFEMAVSTGTELLCENNLESSVGTIKLTEPRKWARNDGNAYIVVVI